MPGTPATTITLKVGQVLGLHITRSAEYPLPDVIAPSIVKGISTVDPSTATYRAVAPGTAVLMTTRKWIDYLTNQETTGPGPVARSRIYLRGSQ